MSTIFGTPPQTQATTPTVPEQAQHVTTPSAGPSAPKGTHHVTVIVVAVVAVVALVAALAALLVNAGTWTTTSPAPTTTASAFPFDAYGPGAATWTEQVPAVVSASAVNAAHNTALFTAYGPGTTVYAEQVPATAPTLDYWEGAYGHGTATYQEQVPAAVTPVVPHGAAPFE